VPSTLTGAAASATQSTAPTASVPADGDSLAASGVQGPFQTILNHIAKIWAGAFAAIGSNPALQATGSATRAGLSLVPQAAPSGPADGDVWVETTSNQVKARVAGATQTLGIPAPALTTVTPSAGWTTVTNQTIAYWKDGFGVVHLKGAASFGSGSGPVFILPAGFRPAFQKLFMAGGLGATTSPVVVIVNADGTVFIDNTAGAFASGYLEGVTFLAEA
jgi:hypothetical protein